MNDKYEKGDVVLYTGNGAIGPDRYGIILDISEKEVYIYDHSHHSSCIVVNKIYKKVRNDDIPALPKGISKNYPDHWKRLQFKDLVELIETLKKE